MKSGIIMSVTYSIVWVSPKNPSIILDEFSTGYKSLEYARQDYEHILALPEDDGLDWVPRITKVTEEFI